MKICIDVTEMLKTNYISGIQRVVKEITIRWIEKKIEVMLLSYDLEKKTFHIVDNIKYYNFYTGRSEDKMLLSCTEMHFSDFNREYIFFDLDSVWNHPLKRSYLYPILKKQQTKIVVHIYDTIPVTEPQFCHEVTVVNFMECLGAQLKHADLIIANAQATVNSMKNIIGHTDVKKLNVKVVKLGCDLKNGNFNKPYRDLIAKIPRKGKYVLMVGTIEPRKNHAYVLNAFEKVLFQEGISLVLAGRVGWNVEGLMKRIREHPEYEKRLYLIEDASDEEIVYLYNHALAVAFPSYNEGFGLPVIEAMNHGALVLAADIPVLREVGGERCRYFSLENTDEFINLVSLYCENEAFYHKEKEKISCFHAQTWDDCANAMYGVLKYVFAPFKIFNRFLCN